MDGLIFVAILSGCTLVTLLIFAIKTYSFLKLSRVTFMENHITFDPQIDKLVSLAVDCWRLEKNIAKVSGNLGDDDVRRIENSINRIKLYLKANDIEIEDLEKRPYNEGMNIEILAVEQDPEVIRPVIFETHSPIVFYQGVIRKKLQAIIHEPVNETTQNEGELKEE